MTGRPPRVVFDESSVRFDELDSEDRRPTVEAGLEALADSLYEIRSSGTVVVVSPFLADAECWPGYCSAPSSAGSRSQPKWCHDSGPGAPFAADQPAGQVP